MKRNYLIAAMLTSGVAFAQQPTEERLKATSEVEMDFTDEGGRTYSSPIVVGGSETAIWSEDFGNGIPSTWTNEGFDLGGLPYAAAVWEYRGPNTNPSNATGSRGWLAGPGNPILSPTASNGFVVFDSDYLETGGSGIGQGIAPGPHVGVLTTDLIDLSSESNVVLELFTYVRPFNSRFYVAFSIDGGTTYPDSIEVLPASELPVNVASARDFHYLADVSSYIGGESNVRLKIIYVGDSRTGAAPTPQGLYFWQLDDIAIKPIPQTYFTFESFEPPAGGLAPPYDIINQNSDLTGWGPAGNYGITTLRQARAIAFDANVRNFGTAAQTNVALEVEIFRGNVLETTVSSPAVPILAPGDLADFSLLTTGFWTPSQTGTYSFVYKVTSDSLTLANNSSNTVGFRPDTVRFRVSDYEWAADYLRSFNGLGTAQLGDDASKIAVRYEVKVGERDQIWSAIVGLTTQTQPGGEIEAEIFQLSEAGIGGTSLGSRRGFASKVISQNDITRGYAMLNFYNDPQGTGEADIEWTTNVPDSAYWLVVTMYSNNGNSPISIRNDQTLKNTNQSWMFHVGDFAWYSGYSNNSRSLAKPHIRMMACSAIDPCQVSVDDFGKKSNNLKIYPNPTNGIVVIDFLEPAKQDVVIRITDMSGKLVYTENASTKNISQHQIELGQLSAGVYIMSIDINGKTSTYKVAVEK